MTTDTLQWLKDYLKALPDGAPDRPLFDALIVDVEHLRSVSGVVSDGPDLQDIKHKTRRHKRNDPHDEGVDS